MLLTLAIVTGGSELGGVVSWWMSGLRDKLEDPSCYSNKAVTSFPFCNGMKCIPCS